MSAATLCGGRSNIVGRRLAAALLLMLPMLPVEGRIASVSVERSLPFAQDHAFDGVAYRRVDGIARGVLDPASPSLADLHGITAVQTGSEGRIEYSTPFTILLPAHTDQVPRRILFEVVNRGSKLALPWLNEAPETSIAALNDPRVAEDAGNGFLMRQRYSLVWAGWSPPAGPAAPSSALFAGLPPLNSAVDTRRPVRFSWVAGGRGRKPGEPVPLPFEADRRGLPEAQLLERCGPNDDHRRISPEHWAIDAAHQQAILDHGIERHGCQYSLSYRPESGPAFALGYAVVRDLVSYLRYSDSPDNPLRRSAFAAGDEHIIGLGISQSGRFLRSFLELGMNTDEAGRQVFQGLLVHIAGAGKLFLNAEHAQPDRTVTSYDDAGYPEIWPPFSAADYPLENSPKVMEINTGSEYWQKAAYLTHITAAADGDRRMPPWLRSYLIAGMQHGSRPALESQPGSCRHPSNPSSPAPVLRALLVRLGDWVRGAGDPPDSRVPRLADGTLVPIDRLDWPRQLPSPPTAVCYRADGVADALPARCAELPAPLVPQVDRHGNEIAGIRLPHVAIPLGTFTGWNEYASPFPAGTLCDRTGSRFPLARSLSPEQVGQASLLHLRALAKAGFILEEEVEDLARQYARP